MWMFVCFNEIIGKIGEFLKVYNSFFVAIVPKTYFYMIVFKKQSVLLHGRTILACNRNFREEKVLLVISRENNCNEK
jgi:hypothetical protein